jgi:hypothetical protein
VSQGGAATCGLTQADTVGVFQALMGLSWPKARARWKCLVVKYS